MFANVRERYYSPHYVMKPTLFRFEEMWPVRQHANFILSNNYLVLYNKNTGWYPSALVRQSLKGSS